MEIPAYLSKERLCSTLRDGIGMMITDMVFGMIFIYFLLES